MMNFLPYKAERLSPLPQLAWVCRHRCAGQGNVTIPIIIDPFPNVTTAHNKHPFLPGECLFTPSSQSDDIVRQVRATPPLTFPARRHLPVT